MNELTNRQRMICELCEMATPPTDAIEWGTQSSLLPASAGVYFAWRNGAVEYVGRSFDVRSRVRSHQVVTREHSISVLRLKHNEVHVAELFYIWLLKPSLNSQVIESQHKTRASAVLASFRRSEAKNKKRNKKCAIRALVNLGHFDEPAPETVPV